MKVVITGGGWAGCAAALAARKQGAETVLVERTDMLLGTGLVGGIMRNNGRFTATEEMIALGGGELFELTDTNSLHRDIEFPGHPHASRYNVATMEPLVRALLIERGVDVRVRTRIDGVEPGNGGAALQAGRLGAVTGKRDREPVRLEADTFVDTTGTAGPTVNCTRYGNGCVTCILRCPTFGGRVSLTALCGVTEKIGRKGDTVGAMSGSCKLLKESLSPPIIKALNGLGVAIVPIPAALKADIDLSFKACQQYAGSEFKDNLVLLDTGHAKLMTPFFPLESLRRVPGFEHARYEDPYAGGVGNSIRYVGMSPRDDALRVAGIANLFCAGEKAGLLVGHTEAIVTGTLAGYNAARAAAGRGTLVLPPSLAVGDAIRHVREQMDTEKGLGWKYTFSGSVYFERMKSQGLYTTDIGQIRARVARSGLSGVFARTG
jgi:hypothetical protein